jgi:hypothetical protein
MEPTCRQGGMMAETLGDGALKRPIPTHHQTHALSLFPPESNCPLTFSMAVDPLKRAMNSW